MSECRHRESILSWSGNDETQEDLHLYMSTGETRGMLTMAPALWDHVTEGTPSRGRCAQDGRCACELTSDHD